MTNLVKIILLLTMLCSLFFGCYSDKEESTDTAVTVETTVATFPTVEETTTETIPPMTLDKMEIALDTTPAETFPVLTTVPSGPSSQSGSGSSTKPQATQPPATQPPATEAPVTQPPATQSPASQEPLPEENEGDIDFT